MSGEVSLLNPLSYATTRRAKFAGYIGVKVVFPLDSVGELGQAAGQELPSWPGGFKLYMWMGLSIPFALYLFMSTQWYSLVKRLFKYPNSIVFLVSV